MYKKPFKYRFYAFLTPPGGLIFDLPVIAGLSGKLVTVIPIQISHSSSSPIRIFEDRLQKLEDLMAKNSDNSGKPPLSDGLAKKPKSVRHKRGKKCGGQTGHPEITLKAAEGPDHIEILSKTLSAMPGIAG